MEPPFSPEARATLEQASLILPRNEATKIQKNMLSLSGAILELGPPKIVPAPKAWFCFIYESRPSNGMQIKKPCRMFSVFKVEKLKIRKKLNTRNPHYSDLSRISLGKAKKKTKIMDMELGKNEKKNDPNLKVLFQLLRTPSSFTGNKANFLKSKFNIHENNGKASKSFCFEYFINSFSLLYLLLF